jgi:hypothetical protein
MLRQEPAVMLHAPLQAVLYADSAGLAGLAVDQPSLLFAGYHSPELASVGSAFDRLLAGPINLLGGDVAPILGGEAP